MSALTATLVRLSPSSEQRSSLPGVVMVQFPSKHVPKSPLGAQSGEDVEEINRGRGVKGEIPM